jgi:hypothetical protein
LKNTSFISLIGLNNTVDLSGFFATYGIILTAIDLSLLSPYVLRLRQKAAKIQESFDCEVLEMPWNNVLMDKRPDDEDIHHYSKKYFKKCKGDPGLKDWYSPIVGELDMQLARVVCQRSNLWWDADLRKKFRFSALCVAIVLFSLLLFLGLVNGVSLEIVVTQILAPFLPAFVLLIKLSEEHQNAINRLVNLKNKIEELLSISVENPTSADSALKLSSQIQDGLAVHRSSAPPIFDWFYWRRRERQESGMNYSVGRLVNEIKNKRMNKG